MTVRAKLASANPVTIDEYLAFTDTRPDGERWELIEGVAVLNPSPIDFHQLVAGNIVSHLLNGKVRPGGAWLPLIGVGTHVPASPHSLPQPDVFVLEGARSGRAITDDAIVIFEVLSRSSTKADREWRRRVYICLPNCQHYVTISLKAAAVTAFDRPASWAERTARWLENSLDFPALGLILPFADVYRYTPLGQD